MKFPFLVVLFFLSLLHATPSKPFVEDAKVVEKQVQEAIAAVEGKMDTRAREFIIKPNEVDQALVGIAKVKKEMEQFLIGVEEEKKSLQQQLNNTKLLSAMMNNPSQQSIQIDGKTYTRDKAMMLLGEITHYFKSNEDFINKAEISLKNWVQNRQGQYNVLQRIEHLTQLVLSFKNKKITEQEFLEKQKDPDFEDIFMYLEVNIK
jgi:hypothetical protein